MKKSLIAAMAAGLTLSAVAQTATGAGQSAQTSGASTSLSSGTILPAELTKSLDAKKAKSGDEVAARLTQDVKVEGKGILHKGSKLVGHVTEAQAKSKENAESKLGIVFDKAVLKGGEEVAFNGVIQALAPPVQSAPIASDDQGMGSGTGGGNSMGRGRSGGGITPMGGGAGPANSNVNPAASSGGNSPASGASGPGNRPGGASANGTLNAASRGVVGMQDLTLLNASPGGGAQGSMITSASRNVKLDSGTQLILQVAGSAPAR